MPKENDKDARNKFEINGYYLLLIRIRKGWHLQTILDKNET